jgi:2-C-methyl-D-erythritol 4-phosphate cytidylyltransferase
MTVGVVLPAGGRGLRLGEAVPKQFLDLTPGKPMFFHTLDLFARLPEVAAIALVLPPEYLARYASLVAEYPKLRLAEGGSERWLSVQAGVHALPPHCDSVLIHDVARPFVTPEQIRACIATVLAGGCCTLAMPCTDTIKQVDGDVITATLDRNHLIAVQTPQGFPRSILNTLYAETLSAHSDHSPASAPGSKPLAPTDECMLAEAAGYRVTWVQGGQNARKVTDAEDLLWARWMAAHLET